MCPHPPLFDSHLESLWNHHKERLEWEAGEIILKVGSGPDNDTIQEINLSETIGKVQFTNTNGKDSDYYWLTSEYNQNDMEFRSKVLTPFFVKACAKAGFVIHAKGWEKQRGCIRFQCTRGRFHHEKEERKTAKVYKTIRPLPGEEDTCRFGFNVWWDESKQRWKLPKEQAGTLCHKGHIKLKPDEVKLSLKNQGKSNVERAIKHIEAEIQTSATAAYIEEETGFAVDPAQIRYQKRQKEKRAYQINMAAIARMTGDRTAEVEPNYNPTAADRLIADLQSDPAYTFILMFGDYDTDLLTIRKRTKRDDGQIVEEVVDPETLVDEVDSAATYADKVREQLCVTGTGQVLIAVAWTNNAAQRKLALHPEFGCGDVTEGSNSEKRPLNMSCAKDGEGKGFAHTWGFLPSQSEWVFFWYYGTAMPTLHRRSVLERIRIYVTDQDPQMCRAFVNCIPTVFKNAKHRNCGFHKLNRNLTNHKDFESLIADLRDTDGHVEVLMIVQWL